MTRYGCVDDQKAAGFAVTKACAVMQVSTSAYYDWHAGGEARDERQRRDAQLLAEITAIHRAHPDYGSPRITVELAPPRRPVNHKRVEAMMAGCGDRGAPSPPTAWADQARRDARAAARSGGPAV